MVAGQRIAPKNSKLNHYSNKHVALLEMTGQESIHYRPTVRIFTSCLYGHMQIAPSLQIGHPDQPVGVIQQTGHDWQYSYLPTQPTLFVVHAEPNTMLPVIEPG